MLTFTDELNFISTPPQLDLFLSSWNTANLFSLDRRTERRKSFPVRANIDCNGESRRGRGKNISTSGLSLMIEDPPTLLAQQSIQLCLFNESFHFRLKGIVRGMREMEHRHFENPSLSIVHLAIEFLDVPKREKQILDSLIEGYQERAVSFHLKASFSDQAPSFPMTITHLPHCIRPQDLSSRIFLLKDNFSSDPISTQLRLPIKI